MRILLVTKGDATKWRTWSGVPRQELQRLESEGHEVRLLNLFDDPLFHFFGALWNRLCDYKRHEFESTIIGGWLMARAVRCAAQGFDRVVALTFALNAAKIGVPVELRHDWTLGYFWKCYDRTEARVLARMACAAAIKCYYPASTRYLRDKGLNAEYVGLPVSVPDWVRARIKGKSVNENGGRVVIFASTWHRDNLDEGLRYLGDRECTVDVIGMKGKSDTRIRYHGYLDKDCAEQAVKYWELLIAADQMLALGTSWPGGSSIAEARACRCFVRTREWPDLGGHLV